MVEHTFTTEQRNENRILLPGDPGFEEVLRGAEEFEQKPRNNADQQEKELQEILTEFEVPDIKREPSFDLGAWVVVPGVKTPSGKKVVIGLNNHLPDFYGQSIEKQRELAESRGLALATPQILYRTIGSLRLGSEGALKNYFTHGTEIDPDICDSLINNFFYTLRGGKEISYNLDLETWNGKSAAYNFRRKIAETLENIEPDTLTIPEGKARIINYRAFNKQGLPTGKSIVVPKRDEEQILYTSLIPGSRTNTCARITMSERNSKFTLRGNLDGAGETLGIIPIATIKYD